MRWPLRGRAQDNAIGESESEVVQGAQEGRWLISYQTYNLQVLQPVYWGSEAWQASSQKPGSRLGVVEPWGSPWPP